MFARVTPSECCDLKINFTRLQFESISSELLSVYWALFSLEDKSSLSVIGEALLYVQKLQGPLIS
jgi:hypothetical protein